MSANILLISDLMIKERTAVHGNIEPSLIYPDIKVAQDLYIEPVISTGLYNKLQELINSGTVDASENAKYKLLLDRFIADALIYYTLAELPITISYQFWSKGVLRKNDNNSTTPSMSELIDLCNKYKSRAESYANRLRTYLYVNANQYPEFNVINNMSDIRANLNTFTSPIYLGDGDEKCINYYKPYKP